MKKMLAWIIIGILAICILVFIIDSFSNACQSGFISAFGFVLKVAVVAFLAAWSINTMTSD